VSAESTFPNTLKYLFGIEGNDRNLCIGYSIFAYFMLSYAAVGSLGIAIHRFLYIKVNVEINYNLKK
jgi:hypothetical protein